ncbi:hypothetical protein Peur_003189 [Populus x canadensis]
MKDASGHWRKERSCLAAVQNCRVKKSCPGFEVKSHIVIAACPTVLDWVLTNTSMCNILASRGTSSEELLLAALFHKNIALKPSLRYVSLPTLHFSFIFSLSKPFAFVVVKSLRILF